MLRYLVCSTVLNQYSGILYHEYNMMNKYYPVKLTSKIRLAKTIVTVRLLKIEYTFYSKLQART